MTIETRQTKRVVAQIGRIEEDVGPDNLLHFEELTKMVTAIDVQIRALSFPLTTKWGRMQCRQYCTAHRFLRLLQLPHLRRILLRLAFERHLLIADGHLVGERQRFLLPEDEGEEAGRTVRMFCIQRRRRLVITAEEEETAEAEQHDYAECC